MGCPGHRRCGSRRRTIGSCTGCPTPVRATHRTSPYGRSIAMVVFDSTVPSGTGQGVYMTATAEQLSDRAAIEHGIDVFSRESVRQGNQEWGLERVTGEARLRLYRASMYRVLDPRPGRPARRARPRQALTGCVDDCRLGGEPVTGR